MNYPAYSYSTSKKKKERSFYLIGNYVTVNEMNY